MNINFNINSPNVTVIITTFNGQKFIEKSVKSILNQSLENFQLLVIDDGSEDNTKDIILAIKDVRIEYFKVNRIGHVSSLNYGLSRARARFSSILDHDDIALENKLEQQYKFLTENFNYGVVGCNFDVINEKEKYIYSYSIPSINSEIKKKLLYQNVICHSGVMYNTELIRKVGGYREKFSIAADYDLWLRLYNKTYFYNLKDKLLLYRKHDNALTAPIKNYEGNNKIVLSVLYENSSLLEERNNYLIAVWEIIYGDIKLGRKKIIKEITKNRKLNMITIKYLILSLLNQYLREKYFYYQPFRKMKKLIKHFFYFL